MNKILQHVFLGMWLLLPAALVQATTLDETICSAAKTSPETYLLDIEELPVLTSAPPAEAEFPDASLPGLWVFEVVFLALLGLAALGFGIFLVRRHGGLDFHPINGRTVSVLALALLACWALPLSAENWIRGRQVQAEFETARKAWTQQQYEEADASLDSMRGRQYGSLIWNLTPFYKPALERLDVDSLHTVNGMAAARKAIGDRDAGAARHSVSYFTQDTPPAIAAKLAALSHHGAWTLTDGATESAVESSLAAYQLDPGHENTRTNLCAARYHDTVALARAQRYADALNQADWLESPHCDLAAQDRAVLQGLIARIEALRYLDAEDPLAAPTAESVAVTEAAFSYGEENGSNLPFVRCDYAAALEAHAAASLARKDPETAVPALDRAEEVFPGRAFVAQMLPGALYALGNHRLYEEEFENALSAFGRGFELTHGEDPSLVSGYANAHLLHGTKQHEDGDLDAAIESFEQAYQLQPRNADIQVALADTLLIRGDGRLKAAAPAAARPDFERAAVVSPQRRATAQMRQAFAENAPGRLASLNASPAWLGVPAVEAELPRDLNNDGKPDQVLYFGAAQEDPVAIGDVSSPYREQPNRLLLLGSDEGTRIVLQDHDNNGFLDERITYSNASSAISGDANGPAVIDQLLIDADADSSPDVRVHYQDGVEYSRVFLSGRVTMVIREGVIGAEWADVFSKPDAYVKFYQNGSWMFTSDTIDDSIFPIWNQGIAIEYIHRDRIRLELWDEDFISSDDLLGVFETNELPATSIYRFRDQYGNSKGAVRVSVAPTDLPAGHTFQEQAPRPNENYFRDHEAALEEYGDLISAARQDAVRAMVMRHLAKTAVNWTIDYTTFNPTERTFKKFVAEAVMNFTM